MSPTRRDVEVLFWGRRNQISLPYDQGEERSGVRLDRSRLTEVLAIPQAPTGFLDRFEVLWYFFKSEIGLAELLNKVAQSSRALLKQFNEPFTPCKKNTKEVLYF